MLPEYLKDPANFEDIQKKVFKTLEGTCTHTEIMEMAKCSKCTKKMLERRALLKALGFKNPAQYMAWRKTHAKIRELFPLVDWKSLNKERLMEEMKKHG